MIQLLGLLIVAIVALYVAQPLLNPNSASLTDDRSGPLDDLLARRSTLYRDVADLQFDHGAGKVNDSEYLEQREEYIEEAAVLLQEIDARSPTEAHDDTTGPFDAELEAEIRRHRRTAGGA